MTEMTSRERFRRIFEHQEADRVPITDMPWAATIERWQSEGMPKNMDFADFFDIDRVTMFHLDVSPRYEEKVLEDTDEYTITTSPWGVTMKNFKHAGTTPEFLDFKITDPDKWAEAKERISVTPDRVDWNLFDQQYQQCQSVNGWRIATLWFGFDVTHSWAVGTERVLMAMGTEPEWLSDMFDTMLETNLGLMQMMLEKGYEFDQIFWCDDMGYKGHQFFSVPTYQSLVKPFHKRAVDFAHEHGMKAELHSCGDVNPFVPDFVDMGLDGLNPLEVKAGMDPIALKKEYGDKLVFHGGINALLYERPWEELEAQVREVLPVMKENGGYIFSSDHSVPQTVSVDKFKKLVSLAKELGSYE